MDCLPPSRQTTPTPPDKKNPYFVDISDQAQASIFQSEMIVSHILHEIVIIFILCLFEVKGIEFQESGPKMVPDEKAEVVITCSHNDSSRPLMLWYQQKQGSGPLVLLGYNYGATTSNYEDGIKEQFEIKMDDRQSGSLAVREANVTHTAVYFCAAVKVKVIEFQESGPKIVPDEKAEVVITCSHNDSSRPLMLCTSRNRARVPWSCWVITMEPLHPTMRTALKSSLRSKWTTGRADPWQFGRQT
ncbi:uncharacterized protein LOC115544085 [Gadus morhua]|uniref:uncharacterized protein LOC115544085 n=1 Tax=Gadus morhua TaxID=8049 RepID=UPI0011B751EB|nr:uncharacterized protein LOC115544085 [Gadus morhua]